MILGHDSKTNERLRSIARDLGFVCEDIERVKTFIHSYINIAKLQNWEIMSMSTAQGAAAVNTAYGSAVFDGRYIYFTPLMAVTLLRYDTTLLFTSAVAWEKMSLSTAMGRTVHNYDYMRGFFDGRYVYYSPYMSTLLMRFDTSQAFTTVAAWEKINLSTAMVSSVPGWNMRDIAFDGRYVYICADYAKTHLRFDNSLTFTNSSAWERMSISTAQGASIIDDGYYGCVFEGRYVYYVPAASKTFLRFDSTLAFTNSSAWSGMSKSTVLGTSAAALYEMALFDGRYIYFCPDSAVTFVRYDTLKSFTNSSAWELINQSTVQGASVATSYKDAIFDGRYVYFAACNADSFARFDTTKPFTNSSSWQVMSMSTAQGAAALDNAYIGVGFDGKYIYFSSYTSDSFLRLLACPNKDMRV